jgi:hypothetical protein
MWHGLAALLLLLYVPDWNPLGISPVGIRGALSNAADFDEELISFMWHGLALLLLSLHVPY